MLDKTQSLLPLILLIQNYFLIQFAELLSQIEELSTQGLVQPAVISTQ